MMSRRAVGAAAVALFLSGSVHADVLVQTSLGKLNATLVDLDPNDGIDPSLSFAPVPLAPNEFTRGASVNAGARLPGGWKSGGLWEYTPDIGTAVDAGWRAAVTASVENRPDPLQTTLAVSVRTAHDQDYLFAFADASSDTFSYVLSPHTSLVFTLPGTSFARGDDGRSDRFLGYAVFSADLRRPDGLTMDSGSQTFYNDRQDGWGAGPYEHAEDFVLTVSLTNPSGEAWQGEASFSSEAWTAANPLPVPEPANAAMLAAGVGLLGWRCRGRRRAA